MTKISADSYLIFEDAMAAGKTLYSAIEQFSNVCDECKSTLGNADVLEGPVADDLQDMFTSVQNDTESIKESIGSINNYLAGVKANYMKGDKDAANSILSVDDILGTQNAPTGGEEAKTTDEKSQEEVKTGSEETAEPPIQQGSVDRVLVSL